VVSEVLNGGSSGTTKLECVTGETKIFPVTEKRLVWTTLIPGPPTSGPARRKKLVPKGLPMMAWSVVGWPMNPAGGSDTAGSHCRKGPTLGWARAKEKAQAGGGGATSLVVG